MTIIAVCGFKGAGKDTIGAYLVEKYGFKKLSFASVLKDIVAIIFDWDRNKLEGITNEDREWREKVDDWWASELNIPNLTPRFALQYFGTDLFRKHFHNDIWIKIIKRQLTKYKDVIITDMRFPNEAELLRSYGCKIIHVYKELPEWFNDYKNKLIDEIKFIHPSEYMWIREKFDYSIDNNGTYQELYTKIDNIFQ